MEKLLTVKDVADFLRMSKEKVYKLAQDGKIPVIKIENQWRFRQDRINIWLETKEMGLDQVLSPENLGREKACPFLKWAGGKGQLINQYQVFFPTKYDGFLEPFVGAGAVFFHLYNSGQLGPSKKAILIDSAEELVNCFQAIKKDPEELIKKLKLPKFANDEKQFYRIREEEPSDPVEHDPVERAARTIYLNKTCFNGLYRVNSKGKFNVPYGKYTNPLICDEDNLRAVHQALKNVDILCDDFTQCLQFAGQGDFVYLDPPYLPLSITSNFTGYTKDTFQEKDQERLAATFKKLDKADCKVMLSSSNTPLIRQLYEGFRIEEVLAKRAINSKASGRGQISELVILNY